MAKRMCSVKGCERTHSCRGWCQTHYMRWFTTGDPMADKPVSARRKWTETNATAVMHAAGFDPQEPFPGARFSWACLCLTCNRPAMPSVERVLAGSGCSECWKDRKVMPTGRQTMSEASARDLYASQNLDPIGPYPGRGTAVWPAQCSICGFRTRSTPCHVKEGHGCGPCSLRNFNPDTPHVVYLVSTPGRRILKFGITCDEPRRLRSHERAGFTQVVETWNVPNRAAAIAVERTIIDHCRTRRWKPPVTKGSGARETILADDCGEDFTLEPFVRGHLH